MLSVIPQQRVDPAPGGRYPKTARVLRTAEFRNIYDNGVRLSTPLFAAFCFFRPDGAGARLGLTVPRAIGGSVERNRIKRRLREAFRLHRARFASPLGAWDIVLNPRRAVLDATFAGIEQALEKVMHRCQA